MQALELRCVVPGVADVGGVGLRVRLGGRAVRAVAPDEERVGVAGERQEGEGGQVGDADGLARGVLAAVDVGDVLERVGGGADEREVVLAGLDDTVGGGVLASAWKLQKSTTTLRPASPPLALTMLAQALTAFTDFWNRPGESDVSTSAIMPTLIVVAVSPTSVPGAAEPAGEAAVVPAAAVADAAEPEVVLDDAPVDELLELQPAASRAAASAAVTPRRRRAGSWRCACARAARPVVVSCHSGVLHDVIACERARGRRLAAPRTRGLVTASGRVVPTGRYMHRAGRAGMGTAPSSRHLPWTANCCFL